jgi:chondroitin 4-sulfotransferase 11
MQAIISHTHKYIYFYIPKVACSTIRKMLANFEGIPWYHAWDKNNKTDFKYIKTESAHTFPYFKFAFVRNPWDRLVSCYFDKVVESRSKSDNVAIKDGVFRGFLRYNKDFKNMKFLEFVDLVSNLNDNESNGHFRSQYTFINNADFIGRFEDLHNDLNKLRKKLGIDIQEEHLMKSSHKNYKDYYNNKSIDMIKERYKEDIKFFGYKY